MAEQSEAVLADLRQARCDGFWPVSGTGQGRRIGKAYPLPGGGDDSDCNALPARRFRVWVVQR